MWKVWHQHKVLRMWFNPRRLISIFLTLNVAKLLILGSFSFGVKLHAPVLKPPKLILYPSLRFRLHWQRGFWRFLCGMTTFIFRLLRHIEMESEFAVCTNMVTNAAAALGGRRVKSKVVPLSVGKCVNGSTHLSSAHAILLPAAQIWAFNVMSLRVINCHPYM